jgi:pyruvate dehydrogenase E2 component (dihydrolipoamide acetyltransferase)
LAVEVGRLEAAVGTRQLAPDALSGQTITLSNFGAVAGRYATMVVVPPQVAIVGAGRAYRKPMLDGDDVRAGRALPLSVTFDHRAVTGVEACGFLDAMIGALQKETVQ